MNIIGIDLKSDGVAVTYELDGVRNAVLVPEDKAEAVLWFLEAVRIPDWLASVSRFHLSLPVDKQVVALLRLPIGITPLVEVTQALENAFGPNLVIRTDTGLTEWCVIGKPKPAGEAV